MLSYSTYIVYQLRQKDREDKVDKNPHSYTTCLQLNPMDDYSDQSLFWRYVFIKVIMTIGCFFLSMNRPMLTLAIYGYG